MSKPLFSTVIETDELRRAAEVFRVAPELVQEELVAGIWEAELLLMREARELAPRAAGTFADSIIAQQPELQGGAVLGVVASPLAYAAPVELGTKPHMPPLQPLIDWVEAKLGIKGPKGEEVAQAIRWKIKAHGTKGAFAFKRALEGNLDQLRAILTDHARGGLARAGLEPM